MSRFDTYGKRLRHALWIRHGVTGEDLTQARLADLVAAETGGTFQQTTAGGWLRGAMPRELTTQLALARVLSVGSVVVDPGWLFYGPAQSQAPAPVVPAYLMGATPASGRSSAESIPIEDEELPAPAQPLPKRVAEAGRSRPASGATRPATARGKRRPKR